MSRTVLVSLLLVLAAATPLLAQEAAQQDAAPKERPRDLPPSRQPTLIPKQSDRGGAFVLRGGMYAPENILRNGPESSVTYKDIYGGSSGMYALEWELQPLRLKYIGILGMGLGGGYFQKTGKALREDGTKSSQELKLRILPAMLDIVYRMALFENQWVVPYAGAGLDYWYYTENKTGGDAADNISGAKKGWHWRAGGQLLLDVFDPRSAGALDSNWGLNNTYLFGEYRDNRVNNFNKPIGFDLSDRTWAAGLMLDY